MSRIIDSVDKNKLHELFVAGEKLNYMAKAVNISVAILNNYIKEQQAVEPEKWPYRQPPGERKTKWR